MPGTLVDRALAAALPAVPKPLVRTLASRYIAGPTLADALARIRALHSDGRASTVDVLGEQLTTRGEIEALVGEYRRVLEALASEGADGTLSIKPTALGLKLDPDLFAEHVRALVTEAAERSLVVEIDMEDSTTTDATLDVYRKLRADGLDNVGIALQAYLRRTPVDVRSLAPLRPRVRVVKGIWVEPPALVHTDPDAIRESFVRTLDRLLDAGSYVAVASHDEWIHGQAVDLLDRHGVSRDGYEFQMLLGVTDQLGDALVADGHKLRIYVPYGEDWYAYSLRRFKENPRIARYVTADVVSRARGRLRRL